MYCVNCGAKLADTETQCPLCAVPAFHPDIQRREEEPLYPPFRYPVSQVRSQAVLIVATTLFLLPFFITLLCDLQINGHVTWSGFVMGALLVGYAGFVLPFWFQKPNPVIFVPVWFAVVAVYLLYIDFSTGGNWFLPFAFPVVGYVGCIVTAVVVLLRYVPQGRLYIIGGAFLALGAFMPLMEFLICITFGLSKYIGWSFYPLIVLVLLGGMLIFLAISKPARETMERKFFI